MNDSGGFHFIWEKREFISLSRKREVKKHYLVRLKPCKKLGNILPNSNQIRSIIVFFKQAPSQFGITFSTKIDTFMFIFEKFCKNQPFESVLFLRKALKAF